MRNQMTRVPNLKCVGGMYRVSLEPGLVKKTNFRYQGGNSRVVDQMKKEAHLSSDDRTIAMERTSVCMTEDRVCDRDL